MGEQQRAVSALEGELKEVTKQRDRHCGDKQLLQKEMKMVHQQLDELNESKAQLISQIEQLLEFQSNSNSLRAKMEQYTRMTACNQQRIQQLEAMKTTLENDNLSQSEQFGRLQTENREREEAMDRVLERNTAMQEDITSLLRQKEEATKEGQEQSQVINKLQQIIENQQSKLNGLYHDSSVSHSLQRDNDRLSLLAEQQSAEMAALREQHEATQQLLDSEIADLETANASLAQDVALGEQKLSALEQRIVCKFQAIRREYDAKADALETALFDNARIEGQKQELLTSIQSLRNDVEAKNERIQSLEGQMAADRLQQQRRDELLDDKMSALKAAVLNKLSAFDAISRRNDAELEHLNEVVLQLTGEIEVDRLIDDENDMLQRTVHRLQSEVEELNRSLNDSHSKHRMARQMKEASAKSNEKLQLTVCYLRERVSHFQHEIACQKHESAQIHRHRDHIKEKCWALDTKLLRYKEKFESAHKESTLLRRKTTVMEQLMRLNDDRMQQLLFDKKAGSVREQMLCDVMQKMNGQQSECLSAAFEAVAAKLTKEGSVGTVPEGEATGQRAEGRQSMALAMERVEDLKAECDHHRQIATLNEQNNMDLKQQTALFTHQILENWQKMFEKLASMINIKAYTVEILQSTVNDIIALHRDRQPTDCQRENLALSERVDAMKDTIRRLEAKHRRDQIELKGLLDREVHLAHTQRDCMEREVSVYRTKLQAFYSKYRRGREQKEQKKLAEFMDGMRHEMSQIAQENTTMATVTNSLREIVRGAEEKTQRLETQNEAMYRDIHELCQYMQQISGEPLLSEDEENRFSASNLGQMVSAVKQKVLSMSSSMSSLHREDEPADDAQRDSDAEEEGFTMVDHSEQSVCRQCPICEQEFNQMVWKYKCVTCQHFHCSICAPIRKSETDEKVRECHACHQSDRS